jgi:15-cis-phytoene synthase
MTTQFETTTPPNGKKTRRRDPAAVLATSTFHAGLLLLPRHLRKDARNLYYLLRSIDDLVDEHDPRAPERVAALERWHYGEKTGTPETAILEQLCRRHPIPTRAIKDFCQGMREDLDHVTMNTEADLERYSHNVAGTVGVMLSALLGTTHDDGPAHMETLGRAMQRTNILRDIDEDLANDRIYIPSTTIERHGFPTPSKRARLLADQIACADALYEQGMQAIPMLKNGADAMAISAKLYREILRQIERDGFGDTPGRPTVSASRRRAIIAEHQLHARAARRATANLDTTDSTRDRPGQPTRR